MFRAPWKPQTCNNHVDWHLIYQVSLELKPANATQNGVSRRNQNHSRVISFSIKIELFINVQLSFVTQHRERENLTNRTFINHILMLSNTRAKRRIRANIGQKKLLDIFVDVVNEVSGWIISSKLMSTKCKELVDGSLLCWHRARDTWH